MLTTWAADVTTWAVDLKDVGAVYPWQGSEVIMVIAAVAFWVIWHIWQIGHENRTYTDEINEFGSTTEKLNEALSKNHDD
ncbi:MAG: hypothetical protein V3V97_09345 [Hyphomicrobiaceae bacterium]